MKEIRALMGMPITVEIADASAEKADIDAVFSYFENIEERFSFFKADSEISSINDGRIKESQWSSDMRTIFSLAEKTKRETNGYFDISIPGGKYNPSGIVKGWAIYNASKMLLSKGFHNFYVDAGGDIQAHGKNEQDLYWSVGIKHPFDQGQIVKVIYLKDRGIATSGTYIRGQHIYDPYERNKCITEIVSMSVIGPDVFEADRFATAAFAMGSRGIDFIENLEGFEGYVINKDGIATKTSGFEKFCDYKKI
jgi:thiamine biosynthesis lipoprotein